MEWYFNLIIYFVVGVVQDFLVTLNWRYVARDKVIPAVVFSFFATVVGWLIFYNIITTLTIEKSVIAIAIYSFGIALGTYLAMKFKVGLKD